MQKNKRIKKTAPFFERKIYHVNARLFHFPWRRKLFGMLSAFKGKTGTALDWFRDSGILL